MRRTVLLLLALAAAAPRILAQHAHEMTGMSMDSGATSFSFRAQAIGLVTRVQPAIAGRTLTEGYLSQPVLMAHLRAWDGRLALSATLDGEGVTLRRGELNTGIYGEGYVDRRHPHTYVHELVASFLTGVGRTRFSIAAGKGFAPFGSDDPMMRPFAAFPVNHHLAQILERAVVIGAVRAGPAMLEVGTFNGDEPLSPGSAPRFGRIGDSWAARLTLSPFASTELRASAARVASPEDPAGNGLDQRKWSVVARWGAEHPIMGGRYAMAEWARTDEYNRGQPAFRFTSLLAEGASDWRGVRAALRLERTIRPEEERLANPFRTVFPTAEVQLAGRTRFTIATLALEPSDWHWLLEARPFLELSSVNASPVDRPAVFVPAEFYGSSHIWNLSAGVRVGVGTMGGRMGMYGIAASP